MKLRLTAVASTIVALLIVATAGQDVGGGEDKSQSEPPANFVYALKPGEREYLSPNLIGVQNIAMSFLPLSMNFVNIIDAFREIVNGVRYELLLNAVDTKANGTEVVCQLVVLEKPWLTTEWGDKVRQLTATNCSRSAEEELTDATQRAKALNDKYQKNSVFNGGSTNELGSDEMANLLAQIIPNSSAKRYPTVATRPTTTTTTEASHQLSEGDKGQEAQATSDDSQGTTTPQPPNEDGEGITAEPLVARTQRTIDAKAGGPSEAPAVLSDDEMKWLDDFFSLGALKFEATQQEQRQQRLDELAANEEEPPAAAAAATSATNAFENHVAAEEAQSESFSSDDTTTATTLMDSPDNYDTPQHQQQEAWQIAVAAAA